MTPLDELIAHCDALLDAPAWEDYGPNGLQVPGPAAVERVATGVSACAELFTAAADAGAQLVLVHHGLFWRGGPLGLDAVTAARLRLLFRHDMALAAYHLPLDGHPGIGNNVLLARALRATEVEPAFPHGGREVGVVARFAEPLTADELSGRIAQACDRFPLHLEGGPDEISTVGIVTGGAPDDITPAAALGCDAFVTGEPAERVTALARELGIHFFAAGHHATETFGVRALGDELAERFGVEHVWIDVPNPV